MPDYSQYQQELSADIAVTLKKLQSQPILFIGSGFSLRYASGPTWSELLAELAARCPLIDKDFAYYQQKLANDLPAIGSVFSELYFEWAWTPAGRSDFPDELFAEGVPRDSFIKFSAAQILRLLSVETASPALKVELSALVSMGAHAVITTNYDDLLEPLFPNYEVVVGQNVFRQSALVVGEIFKIHGSIGDPNTIVFTKEDYEAFDENKKYLSAKLLTYFAEHPLLFVGYSATDPNIRNVLHDISKMFRPASEMIPNIYILQWDPDQSAESYPARDHVIEVGDDVTVRIKCIVANSFDWVYRAFGVGGTMEKVDLKALRALAHRMVNLIRTDIPTKNIQVNYESLEHAISNEEAFGNLFGVTNLGDPAAANANHPYTSAMFAKELELDHWTATNKLIARVRAETGFDMKASDNIFHVHIKVGQAEASKTRKYSDAAVALLKLVRDEKEYDIPRHLLPAQAAAK
jgi:hypothetical protein